MFFKSWKMKRLNKNQKENITETTNSIYVDLEGNPVTFSESEEFRKITPTLSNVDVSYWLTDWCNEVDMPANTVTFAIDNRNHKVFIFTSRPGWLIGKAGIYADKYKNKLIEIIDQKREIHNKVGGYEVMEYYDYQFIEVTEADYWVNYDPMGEGF